MDRGARALVDGVWIDTLFPTGDGEHSTIWRVDEPSGCYQAGVNVFAPTNFEAQWTRRGRRFEWWSPVGGLLWGGVTTEADRDASDGLGIHAVGYGETLKDYAAKVWNDDLDRWEATWVPNDAVDAAVERGALFSRYGVDLGSDDLKQAGDGPGITVGQLLARAAELQGKRVHVDKWAAITFRADPTEPSLTVLPDPYYMGVADDQFVTKLWGDYFIEGETTYRVTLLGNSLGGTFTLTANGQTTGNIAWNANAAAVATAVQALGGVFATATVTGSASPWVIKVPTGGVIMAGNAANLTGTGKGIRVSLADTFRVVSWEDSAARDAFGPRERSIDLTPLGPITATTAQSYVDGRGAKVGGRMGFTRAVALDHLNLMSMNGVSIPARHVEAGEMLQIPDNRDSRSTPTVRDAIWITLAEVKVTESALPEAVVTPVGFSPRDFEGLLAPPEKPADQTEAA